VGVVLNAVDRIIPKREEQDYNGHRIVLEFDPNAPPEKRWMWRATITRHYDYYGGAESIAAARNAARRQIRKVTGE
jgi:2-polyprenyl-6-methoxyphenol hydroxylase-like FAD-dependent oxidoreductase